MDTPEPVRLSLPSLSKGLPDVPEYPDESRGAIPTLREGIRRGLEHACCTEQSGSVMVNFGIGSDRYKGGFYHGPDGHSFDRCE